MFNALDNGLDIFFDKEANTTNLQVTYLRSFITAAGPIDDGNKRYKSIKDDRAGQDSFVTDLEIEIVDLA